MNVVFDITVLGLGHYYPLSRTGVYRAVENLAEHLGRRMDISFSSGSKIDTYLKTRNYLRSNSGLRQKRVIAPSIDPVTKFLLSFSHKICNRRNNGFLTLPGTRRVYQLLVSGFTEAITLNMDRWPLDSVYHASFFPIPDLVKERKDLSKVVTVYDLIPVKFPELCPKKTVAVFRDMLQSIDADTHVVCISQNTKNDLCRYLDIPPSRVFVVYLAASDAFYPCKDKTRIAKIKNKFGIGGQRYLLSVATLEPRKNHRTVIKSFYRLVKDYDVRDLSLVLVGARGWDYEDMLADVKSSRLKDKIVFTGYVDDRDLAPLYSGAMAFVYPSLYEGFGLPLLEAMQCGTPVITSNTSALPEVAGEAAITLDPKDSDGISRAIYEIYTSSELCRNMEAASIKRAGQFRWSKSADQLIKVYETALRCRLH